MSAAPGAIRLACVQVTCPGQPGRVTYAVVRAGDLARIAAASRADLIISACGIELPPTVLATAALAFAQAPEFVAGTVSGVWIGGPVTCPWCHQAMPPAAYGAHLVRLGEAPDGFVCMPPEGSRS